MYQGQIYEISPDSVVYGTPIESLTFNGDLEFTDKLVEMISELQPEILVHGSSGYPMTLNWGTTVPLYYLKNHEDLKMTFLGVPRMRHDDLGKLNQDMRLLAEQILRFAEEREENIALIVSGDLSHVHQEDGPYGYHESGVPFDQLVQQWFRDAESGYMGKIIELQPTALACGMAGMMLIQRVLELQNFEPIASFYDVPTYFGMGIGYWKL
jgi:aromatic ring-opening dioxygenase LigB subunit